MKKYLKPVGKALGCIAALWVFIKFLLPLCAPLILALLFAILLEAPAKKLIAHGWKRSPASAVLTLLLTSAFAALTYLIIYKGISAGQSFMRSLPEFIKTAGRTVNEYRAVAEKYISNAPEEAKQYLTSAIDSLAGTLEALPGNLYERLLSTASTAAQSGADVLLFIITVLLGTFFASASLPRLEKSFYSLLGEESRDKLGAITRTLGRNLSGYLRSQLILMAMTFFQLITAFLILKVKVPFLIALFTSIVDALPILGVGAVLVPWALGAFLVGSSRLAVGLTAAWVIIALVRSCAQAKLVGDQIGLSPLASLGAIYVGYKSCGIWGMILFPIVLALAKQVNLLGKA